MADLPYMKDSSCALGAPAAAGAFVIRAIALLTYTV